MQIDLVLSGFGKTKSAFNPLTFLQFDIDETIEAEEENIWKYKNTKQNNILIQKEAIQCKDGIKRTREHLQWQNLSSLQVNCKAFEPEGCDEVWKDLHEKANPVSVYLRSTSCDIDWSNISVTQEELDFPLAFFISAYTDARNLELQLRTIFRPHNSYCYHVDGKADAMFTLTVRNMVKCYKEKYPESSIALSSRSVPVYWGHFSIVEAELICLEDLLNNGRSWKYAANLAGSEVMLFSNEELVKNLSSTSKPEIYAESCFLGGSIWRMDTKYGLDSSASYDPEVGSKDKLSKLSNFLYYYRPTEQPCRT